MDGNRRDFIKNGISGLAAVSLAPVLGIQYPDGRGAAQKGPGPVSPPDKKIVRRTLGRTGMKVPVVSFGSGFTNDPSMIRAALDAGITYFDTAPGYGGGQSERVIGDVLGTRDRSSFIVANKIGIPEDARTGSIPDRITAERFRRYFLEELEARLRLLKTDHLDILYVYDAAPPEVLGSNMLKDVLAEVKEQGKVRFVGASFHQNEPAMIRACVEHRVYDVVLTAYNFRQPHQNEMKKAIAEAAAAGLGVVAMKFLAGVYWDKARTVPIDARAALKWVLQDENVHTVIPGMKTIDQIHENVSVMADMKMTPADGRKLRLGAQKGLNGLYCGQCGLCRLQCRNHLDIPAAMRGYMYAYGYGNTLRAKRTLERIPPQRLECGGCGACTVSCSMGFDVRERMIDISRVLGLPDEFLA